MIENFIQNFSDQNKFLKNKNIDTLHKLISFSNENIQICEFLINNIDFFTIEDINYKDNYGWNSILNACSISSNDSHLDLVKLLIKKGADINSQDINGFTPLMVSCGIYKSKNNNKLVEFLLENKCDINLKDNYGNTALIISCKQFDVNPKNKNLKLLIRYGANINDKNTSGCTALMIACNTIDTNSYLYNIRTLLKNGIDVNIQDKYGYTALMYCIFLKNESKLEVSKLLIDKSNLNLQDFFGNTSLMLCCQNLNIPYNKKLFKLLYKNTDCNLFTKFTRYNSLMILCETNNNQINLAKLLMNKTDLDHKNFNNKLINDVCRIEYKVLFERNIFKIIQNMKIYVSECIICDENKNGIKCKYDHFTCLECLNKLNVKCHGCQLFF